MFLYYKSEKVVKNNPLYDYWVKLRYKKDEYITEKRANI